MTYYTGIDVSLRSVSICVVDDKGEVCLEAKVAAEIDAIVERLRRFSSEVKENRAKRLARALWLRADEAAGVRERTRALVAWVLGIGAQRPAQYRRTLRDLGHRDAGGRRIGPRFDPVHHWRQQIHGVCARSACTVPDAGIEERVAKYTTRSIKKKQPAGQRLKRR